MIKYIYKNQEYASLDEIRRVSNTAFPDDYKGLIEITEVEVPPTEAELLAEAKLDRSYAVRQIKVTIDGMVFDGDEASQTRMSRAIAASNLGEKTAWVLADNTIAEVTREQLQQALRLAGEEQTKLWVVPYQAK